MKACKEQIAAELARKKEACTSCVCTRPACGGCAPVIDAEIQNAYLEGRARV
jgi:hypothetical protein